MSNIRRIYIDNTLYFITCVTKNRIPIFNDEKVCNMFFDNLKKIQTKHPYQLEAYVLMPDHFHFLISFSQTNISIFMNVLKTSFTKKLKWENLLTKNEKLWQTRFWGHIIRNDKDVSKHLDYVHYNPVKHGLVNKPENYLFSSYLKWVESGNYEIGWGHVEPNDLKGIDLE